MGVTQRLGTIPLAIFTDASNNIGIGGSPSGSYKFEVTGTGAIAGALSLTGATNKPLRIDSANGNAAYVGSYQNQTILSANRNPSTGAFTDTSKAAAYITLNANAGDGNIVFATTATNNTEPTTRMTILSSGNVGIGTSSPVTTNLVGALTIVKSYNGDTPTSTTAQAYYGTQSSLYLFGRNAGLSIISNNSEEGKIAFGNASTPIYASIVTGSGTSSVGGDMYFKVGSDTERMRIKADGVINLGSTTDYLMIANDSIGTWIENSNATSSKRRIRIQSLSASGTNYTTLRVDGTNSQITFETADVERMRITSGGALCIGTTSAGSQTRLRVIDNTGGQGTQVAEFSNAAYLTTYFYTVNSDNWNAAGTAVAMGRNSSTGRSINAGGTINASGADYAEYMLKAIDETINKGDIVGVNENGELTNIFADAKSFVVKSTNPSYVGGDTWGSVDEIGKMPENPTDEEKAEYEAKLEAARKKVDRVAFSGQVPCNVLNAQVGDYIIPINNNGKIAGQSVTNPTFEQYQISVGKVWKIMEDGRAWIAVKIG
jgi:hypothetical protein